MKNSQDLHRYPGGEIVDQGLRDVASGLTTIPACLVVIAFPKLSRAGLIDPDFPLPFEEGERTLYRLLRELPGDAYSRYNSYLRQLVSFEQAIAVDGR